MHSGRWALLAALGGSLVWAALGAGCVDTNVTLGTPADDPEVPHRAPTIERRTTPTPTPRRLPDLSPTPAPSVAAEPAKAAATPVPAVIAAPVPTVVPVPPATPVPAIVPAAPRETSPSAAPSPPPAPSGTSAAGEWSLGEPVLVKAEPCRSNGVHVHVVVPRPEDLDLTYRGGAVPGIEIRRTARAGTGGFRNAVMANGAVEADLWARGSGLAASAAGYETCASGAAADVSFEFVAHYRR